MRFGPAPAVALSLGLSLALLASTGLPYSPLSSIARGNPYGPGGVLTVTKTPDTNDGRCDADCSLREAITAANPGATIIIPAGTYTLDLLFRLTTNQDLALSGTGPGSTIIQAFPQPNVADFGVLHIPSGRVTISGWPQCPSSPCDQRVLRSHRPGSRPGPWSRRRSEC